MGNQRFAVNHKISVGDPGTYRGMMPGILRGDMSSYCSVVHHVLAPVVSVAGSLDAGVTPQPATADKCGADGDPVHGGTVREQILSTF